MGSTEILKEKFKQYDSNGWGVMNFQDFSKFFTEFLLVEAAIDIENRKFSNESSLNITDIDSELDNYKNSSLALRKKLPKISGKIYNAPAPAPIPTLAPTPTPGHLPVHAFMKSFLEKGISDKDKERISRTKTKSQEIFEKKKQIMDNKLQKNTELIQGKSEIKKNKIEPKVVNNQKNFLKKIKNNNDKINKHLKDTMSINDKNNKKNNKKFVEIKKNAKKSDTHLAAPVENKNNNKDYKNEKKEKKDKKIAP